MPVGAIGDGLVATPFRHVGDAPSAWCSNRSDHAGDSRPSCCRTPPRSAPSPRC
jgi:hypothetical protein